MDMTESLAAKSDQLNASDLAAGPITVTISEVRAGSSATGDQPFHFHFVELPGRPYKPNKGMRRVIAAGWGPETSSYAGRRLTLFNEPSVIYAGAEVGGIRVSHMSHLDKPLKTSLALSQKKKIPYTVQPLIESASVASPEPTAEQVAECADIDVLGRMWKASSPERQNQIEARVAEIQANQPTGADA